VLIYSDDCCWRDDMTVEYNSLTPQSRGLRACRNVLTSRLGTAIGELHRRQQPLTQRLVSCVVVTERKSFKAAGFSVHARPAECLFWWDRMEMPCKICKGKCINLRKQDHALLVCIPSIARCLTTLHASSLFLTFF